jgi:hypothetical protein
LLDDSNFQRYVESVRERQVGFDEVEARLLEMCLFSGYIDSQNESYSSLCENYLPFLFLEETVAFYNPASLQVSD